MAVFRVEKTKGYTIMSNHHLRNKKLSLKAKGLLSQMLSLPEDWDYTLAGLSHINKESIDAIRTAIWELEKAGYVKRHQGRDRKGKMTAIEYTIYEQPQLPALETPMSENPTSGKPVLENPISVKPTTENPMQLIKEEPITDLLNKEELMTDSFPFQSPTSSPGKERKESPTAYQAYESVIKTNIDYDILIQTSPDEKERLDEIVDLILETVCSHRKTIRVAGDDYPADLVKAKFFKLNSEHIRFVMDCMRENTTKIRNIKQYLKATLFNAPSTLNNYYTALVAHDMAESYSLENTPEGGR